MKAKTTGLITCFVHQALGNSWPLGCSAPMVCITTLLLSPFCTPPAWWYRRYQCRACWRGLERQGNVCRSAKCKARTNGVLEMGSGETTVFLGRVRDITEGSAFKCHYVHSRWHLEDSISCTQLIVNNKEKDFPSLGSILTTSQLWHHHRTAEYQSECQT